MRAVIEALQALRGIALVSAVTIVAEVGELSRFAKPRQLMGYSGAVASEDSSGDADPARRHYENRQRPSAARRRRSRVGLSAPTGGGRRPLRKRQAPLNAEVKEIAWKAQHRLHARYRALTARGQM